jgi:hypothetical protein
VLAEALQPCTVRVADLRMELPTKEAGWEVSAESVQPRGFGNVSGLVAFVSDVYLSECLLEDTNHDESLTSVAFFRYLLLDDIHGSRIISVLLLGLGAGLVTENPSEPPSSAVADIIYCLSLRLALSGSELSLLATVTPYFLSYPRLSRFATSRRGQNILRLTTIVCGMTAWAMPGPKARLLSVSVANAAMWCALAGGLFRLNGAEAAKTEALRESETGLTNNPFQSLILPTVLLTQYSESESCQLLCSSFPTIP